MNALIITLGCIFYRKKSIKFHLFILAKPHRFCVTTCSSTSVLFTKIMIILAYIEAYAILN